MVKTKLAPKGLTDLSKAALADLVWALATRQAEDNDTSKIVRVIATIFDAHELGSERAYANARGTDGVSADVLCMRKLIRGMP
jgi:hypothetical protein